MHERRHQTRVDRAEPAWVIGSLCVNGDRALASGDLVALGRIAERLSTHAGEPLHCELLEVVELSRRTPARRAAAAWRRVRRPAGRARAP